MSIFVSFWKTLVKSASEPDYYLTLLGKKFSHSVYFYLFLLLILAVIDVSIFRLRSIPEIINKIDKSTEEMVNSLPSTTTLNYSAGKASFTGLKMPFHIKSPEEAKNAGFGETMITVSTKEEADEKAFFVLLPEKLIIQGSKEIPLSKSDYKYSDLLKDQVFSLDKTGIESKRKEVITALPQAANFFTAVSIPFWFLGMVIATTLTLAFLTLLTNSFSWLIGIRMPFMKTLQLGFHAIGVATVIDVIKYILIPSTDVSLVIPGYLGIMGLVMWDLRTHLVEKR